ncbi:nuclear transcription factor Y subunit C-4-like [Curcuma longa]|uniref:nuclear transcription factor Y subunit C-4-like n=1 Tax=Curcuma longa TaxID=136217 RepID=UPI003D9E7666
MEQSEQPTQPAFRVVPDVAQIAYATAMYQPAAAVVGVPQATIATSDMHNRPRCSLLSQAQLISHQLAYLPVQQYQQQLLRVFWVNQILEIQRTTNFKTNCLPLSRIKKIIKADAGVNMIAAEVIVVFAKACELFILELTLRSWIRTQEAERTTMHKRDIVVAITRTTTYV